MQDTERNCLSKCNLDPKLLLNNGDERCFAVPLVYESFLLLFLSLQWTYKLYQISSCRTEALGQTLLTSYVFIYTLVVCKHSREERIPGNVEPRGCKDGVGVASGTLLGTMCVASLLVEAVGDKEEFLDRWKNTYWVAFCSGLWIATASFLPKKRSLFASYVRAFGFMKVILILVTVLRRSSPSVDIIFEVSMYLFIVKWLLSRWRRCFTICEASLASLGASLLIGGAVKAIVLNAYPVRVTEETAGSDSVTLAALLLTVIIGGLAVPTALRMRYSQRKPSNVVRAVSIGGALAFSAICTYGWLWLMMDGNQEPIGWVFGYVFKSHRRTGLCIFWIVLLSLSLFVVPPHKLGFSSIIARKSYHALAMIMFLPAIFIDVEFLRMGLAVSLVGMIGFEVVRISKVGTLSDGIEALTVPLLDSRDEGVVVMTHMYLLLGCALPLWVTRLGSIPERGVVAAAGVISLGVADSVAAAVGSRYGRLRWAGTRKTKEGTIAGFLSGLLLSALWHKLVYTERPIPWGGLGVSIAYAVLFESFTAQIDNLVLPLVYFSALLLYEIR